MDGARMLLEREQPLEELLAAATSAAEGRGSIIVVGGEAGVGKTSLLRTFSAKIRSSHDVLWGGCEALFSARPLGPLQDMVHALNPRVATYLDEGARAEKLFPAVLGSIQDARRCAVLIFEDVHWADNATLDLIKYLGRRMALLRGALVLSLRSDEVGVDHPLSPVLGDMPADATRRIDLRPLSRQAVEILARQAQRSGEEIFRITAGNPFFATELLAQSDTASGAIPASVRDAVWARITRLKPEERALLEAMSVIPGSAERWLMTSILAGDVEKAIDQCIARGMITNDEHGHLQFRHELARLATLDRLSPASQRSLHATVGTALAVARDSSRKVALSRLVHHAAGAEQSDRVLALAPEAASEAARLGAHQQASALYAIALRHADAASKEVAAHLNEEWAYEAGLAVGIDEEIISARKRSIALWRELGRPERVAKNLRWLSRLHWYRGESQLAVEYIDQALTELAGLSPSAELAMAYSAHSQMHMLHDRTDEAIDWGQRAISLAEELGETETRVHALNNVGSALMFAGRAGGERYMEESLALALEHGLHEQAARAYTNYAEYAVVAKKFELAERILAEGIAFDTQHDLDSWTHYLIGRKAQLNMEQGRFHEAETIADGILKLRHLTLVMTLPALNVLARTRIRLGVPSGGALVEKALTDGLATGEPQNILPARLAIVEHAWLSNDRELSHAQLGAIAQMRLSNFDPWELGEFAVWWRRCGMDAPLEVSLKDIAAPRAAELAGEYSRAAEEWTRLGLPYEAALSLLQANGEDAGSCLARAVVDLDAIEAKPAARFGRSKAASLGLSRLLPKSVRGPYAAARTNPLGLTRRELEILKLMTAGLSNRQIAEQLSRSERTIEHHVSAVLVKLNASNRIDVLLRLRSEPWLQPSLPPNPIDQVGDALLLEN